MYPLTLQFVLTAAAVQFRVVPVPVVADAAKPVGALGAAAHLFPPPPLLPPQAGISIRPLKSRPISSEPSNFFRREPAEPRPNPNSAIPPTGKNIA